MRCFILCCGTCHERAEAMGFWGQDRWGDVHGRTEQERNKYPTPRLLSIFGLAISNLCAYHVPSQIHILGPKLHKVPLSFPSSHSPGNPSSRLSASLEHNCSDGNTTKPSRKLLVPGQRCHKVKSAATARLHFRYENGQTRQPKRFDTMNCTY